MCRAWVSSSPTSCNPISAASAFFQNNWFEQLSHYVASELHNSAITLQASCTTRPLRCKRVAQLSHYVASELHNYRPLRWKRVAQLSHYVASELHNSAITLQDSCTTRPLRCKRVAKLSHYVVSKLHNSAITFQASSTTQPLRCKRVAQLSHYVVSELHKWFYPIGNRLRQLILGKKKMVSIFWELGVLTLCLFWKALSNTHFIYYDLKLTKSRQVNAYYLTT